MKQHGYRPRKSSLASTLTPILWGGLALVLVGVILTLGLWERPFPTKTVEVTVSHEPMAF